MIRDNSKKIIALLSAFIFDPAISLEVLSYISVHFH